MVLALYDLRSKQEYIYRTNRIREISGGSALLSAVYGSFIETAEKKGIKFLNGKEWQGKDFSMSTFAASDCDAEVIYSGGGNLMVLYKDNEKYISANRIFSRMLLDETWTVAAIAACIEVSGDFINDRAKLYRQNALNKNTGNMSVPCSVLPFTQVDMRTYMPIVEKNKYKQESLSRESVLKLKAYEALTKPKIELNSIYLDDLATEKGKESLLAIIYIDGNNMGAKLMQALGDERGYDSCINALRRFSEQTDHDFVDEPIKAIEAMLTKKQAAGINYAKYRKVIAGGDEITLICNARIVPDILDVYFITLNSEKSGNFACAGVAIFHSHAPFADVYEIAEQCCESGKKQSRFYNSNANFIDFHYCRAGITNDMETVRDRQEKDLTSRPYRVDGKYRGYSYPGFISLAKEVKVIGRANIKELAASVIKGDSYYRFETERINSRFKIHIEPKDEKTKKMIFDIAQVYDLWFAGEGEE